MPEPALEGGVDTVSVTVEDVATDGELGVRWDGSGTLGKNSSKTGEYGDWGPGRPAPALPPPLLRPGPVPGEAAGLSLTRSYEGTRGAGFGVNDEIVVAQRCTNLLQ